MVVTGFRDNPTLRKAEDGACPWPTAGIWGARGIHRARCCQNSPGNFPPWSGVTFSQLRRHEARGACHPPASLSPAPRPRAGPPALSGRRRAAAAGLGPLAGYCRRIYCIAACAGCSPAHNRLAVAQGSTLRGKEGGIHSDADCRAFAAVYCRIRPLARDPQIIPLQPWQKGFEGLTRPLPIPALSPPPNFMAWTFAMAAGAHAGWGTSRLSPVPIPEGPEGLRSPTVPGCCWGRRGPPCRVRRHKAGAGRKPGTASSTN